MNERTVLYRRRVGGAAFRASGSMWSTRPRPAPWRRSRWARSEDAERAVAAARRAFGSYSNATREERLDLFESIVSVYKRRLDEVAHAICTEMGAPLKSMARPLQAASVIDHFRTNAAILKDYDFFEDDGAMRTQREPIGVCGMITPWNWPVNQIGCKVAPALAAGCTMVLKPSELAPLSPHVFADILHEAGVPAGVFNLVDGDGPTVGARLASHPDIDFITFTGSTRAGVEVSRAAAPTVKKVALELGGKSANILLEDADFEAAVAGGMSAMLRNTGQNCNAPSRLLVPRDRLAQTERAAAAAAARAIIGDPRDEATTMGPLANQPQFEKVQGLIRKGVEEGARLVCGGPGNPVGEPGKPAGDGVGYFVQPTVFSDVNNGMTDRARGDLRTGAVHHPLRQRGRGRRDRQRHRVRPVGLRVEWKPGSARGRSLPGCDPATCMSTARRWSYWGPSGGTRNRAWAASGAGTVSRSTWRSSRSLAITPPEAGALEGFGHGAGRIIRPTRRVAHHAFRSETLQSRPIGTRLAVRSIPSGWRFGRSEPGRATRPSATRRATRCGCPPAATARGASGNN